MSHYIVAHLVFLVYPRRGIIGSKATDVDLFWTWFFPIRECICIERHRRLIAEGMLQFQTRRTRDLILPIGVFLLIRLNASSEHDDALRLVAAVVKNIRSERWRRRTFHVHRLQSLAILENIVSNSRDVFADGHFFQFTTVRKGKLPDFGHFVGNVDLL